MEKLYLNINKLVIVFFLHMLCFQVYAQKEHRLTLEVNNSQPRTTVEGGIVDAHDGRVIQFGDKFYWYGTAYGNTNGFTTANKYVCYSSKDLEKWVFEGELLPERPEGVYYRPHVIYNESTQKYVLWYNWYPQLWDGQFGVATSDKPTGPFTIQDDNVKMANIQFGLGDLGLFVDDDGTAYVSYNTIQDHMVFVERLDESYTASSGESGQAIAKHVEAGAMFKREGKYYLMTDYTCCFCNTGSGARVYISDHPLDGYEMTGNINRFPGRYAPGLNDGIVQGNYYESLKKEGGEWESVVLDMEEGQLVSELELHFFTGNRPANCGDVGNPRVHPAYHIPQIQVLVKKGNDWEAVSSPEIVVEKRALNELLRLRFDAINVSDLKIEMKASDRDLIYISEVLASHNGKAIDFKPYIDGDKLGSPIIPAQQTYVMELNTVAGRKFIWMGDLWGSASDNIKGYDYQYWSAPLEFDERGLIEEISWTDKWILDIIK